MKNLILLVFSLSLVAADLKLNSARPGDLIASDSMPTLASKRPTPTNPAAEVRFAYALDGDQQIDLHYRGHQAESNSYWMRVSQDQLRAGISLPITAKNALVRVDLVADASKQGLSAALDPSDLVLVDAQGRSYANGAGMSALVTAEQLAEVREKGFAAVTSSFRIKEELGIGNLLLYGNGLAAGVQREYVIQVLEKDSTLLLNLEAQRDTYFANEKAQIRASLSGLPSSEEIALEGRVIAPNGESFPVQFDQSGLASFEASALTHAQGGLWEVEVHAQGQELRRSARTAFALAQASARLSGDVRLSEDDHQLSAVMGLQVSREGRYEVRAILFGHDANGREKAVIQAFSANQLGTGANNLTLQFDKATLAEMGIQAPFSLKDLRLIDQTHMSLLHRQAEALSF